MSVVAPCSDGKLVALQQEQFSRFSLREIDTGKVRVQGTIDQPGVTITQIAWSPDNKQLALDCSDDLGGGRSENLIRIWDPKTGRTLQKLRGHTDYVGQMTYSPDGRMLAAMSYANMVKEHKVHVWDVGTGKELCQYKDEGIGLLAFSPDSKTLVSSSDRHTLVLRELSSGEEIRYKLEEPYGSYATTRVAAFTPDGKVLVVGGSPRIRRLDVTRGKEIPLSAGESEHVSAAALSPDGRLLASCNWDGTIRLYDTATGRLLRSLDQPDPRSSLKSLAFTPDGQRLIYAGEGYHHKKNWKEGIIQVWDVLAGRIVRQFSIPEGTHLAFGLLLPRDGKEVGVKVFRRGVFFYDLKSGKRTSSLTLREAGRTFLAPDGRTLALTVLRDNGREDGRLQLWDRVTGRRIHTIQNRRRGENAYLSEFQGAAFAPNGRTLATLDDEGWLTLREVISGKVIWERQGFGGFGGYGNWQVAFSPDGRMLVTGVNQGLIRWLDAATGQEIRRVDGHDGSEVSGMTFSANGRWLVSWDHPWTGRGNALVWDMKRLVPMGPAQAAPAAAQLPTLWKELGSDRADRAYQAQSRLLVTDPTQTVSMLRTQLQSVPRPDSERLKQLLMDLDNNEFAVRKQATAELTKLGDTAEPALRRLLEQRPSLEVRKRVENLLEKVENWRADPTILRQVRAIAVLEDLDTVESRRLLESLAAGAPGARLTEEARAALDRLSCRPR
jgi:WD40 repeat protein